MNTVFNFQNKIENSVSNRLTFGSYTAHKLMHLEKSKSFTWDEETITTLLKSQIAGQRYSISSTCPAPKCNGDSNCNWNTTENNYISFIGNMISYNKEQENKYTGSDLGISIFSKDMKSFINIYFQAKKVPTINDFRNVLSNAIKKDDQYRYIKKT